MLGVFTEWPYLLQMHLPGVGNMASEVFSQLGYLFYTHPCIHDKRIEENQRDKKQESTRGGRKELLSTDQSIVTDQHSIKRKLDVLYTMTSRNKIIKNGPQLRAQDIERPHMTRVC